VRRRQREVYVVTDVGTSRAQDRLNRQRAYLIKMGIRTLAFVLAIILYAVHVPLPIVLVLILAALLLPGASVIAANAGPRQDRPQRPERTGPEQHHQLGPGKDD
jgi:hypothetical protein